MAAAILTQDQAVALGRYIFEPLLAWTVNDNFRLSPTVAKT